MDINKRTRIELKSYFVKNAIPTERNFADLIDGMINQKDDGIAKLPGNPLSIEASGDPVSQKKTLNLFSSFADDNPSWVVCLNPRANPGDPNTARPGFSISDAAGQSRLFVEQTSGSVGINTVTPAARLQVADGAIMPAPGSSKASGIQFPENAFGGSGDGAWIRYYARSGEGTTLEIGTSNDADDHIALMASGNVGIGTNSPSHKLHVRAENAIGLFESSGTDASLRLSTREGLGNRVELANRPGGRLALWTAGTGDALSIKKDGKVGIGTTDPQTRLQVDGWVRVLGDTNPLNFTHRWAGSTDAATNVAEISNDTDTYKTLMIVGNRSAGGGRRVSVWDVLEVNGTLNVTQSITVSETVRAPLGVIVNGNRSDHLNTDGALYRYGGQVYFTVDDNLYIRDSNGDIKLHIDTNAGIIRQGGWVNASFQDGWTNYGNGYNNAGYFKDKQGIVHLRGLVKNGQFGWDKGIFHLPAGCRPAARQLHIVCTSPNTAGRVAGRVDVRSDGRVVPVGGSQDWLSLDDISFRAA